jgi:radical SAM superfamily enzyme YgiQ (UPF0313 family)
MSKIGKKIRKKFKKTIICGGPHPTFYPEVINENYLDAICVGEGEEALLEFVNALEKGKSIIKIKNFFIKKNGKIYKNNLRPLIKNLDSIPFPDRIIYFKYDFLKNRKNEINSAGSAVVTSRGCPFNCSFCFNKAYKKLYKYKGEIFRRRSVSNVIEEIKSLKKEYKDLRHIIFLDDIFTLQKKWINKFLKEYKKNINLPFSFNTRFDLIDEKLIKKLKDANCFSIRLGIESGNENLRNNVLNKKITNEQIIKYSELIKKYGIKLQTYNILGIPGESLEDALDTFNLNKKIRPIYAFCSLLHPYPGTEIFEYAIKRGYINKMFHFKNLGYSYFTGDIPFKIENKKEICNLQKIFQLGVFLKLPTKLIKFLIKLPLTRFYELILGINIIIFSSLIYDSKISHMIKVAYLSRDVLKR